MKCGAPPDPANLLRTASSRRKTRKCDMLPSKSETHVAGLIYEKMTDQEHFLMKWNENIMEL